MADFAFFTGGSLQAVLDLDPHQNNKHGLDWITTARPGTELDQQILADFAFFTGGSSESSVAASPSGRKPSPLSGSGPAWRDNKSTRPANSDLKQGDKTSQVQSAMFQECFVRL